MRLRSGVAVTLVAGCFVLIGGVLQSAAQASDPIVGDWRYEGGLIRVDETGAGFIGTVVKATTLDSCSHKPGEVVWHISGGEATGYLGTHQWFAEGDCSRAGEQPGSATWAFMQQGARNILHFCTTSPTGGQEACADLRRQPTAPVAVQIGNAGAVRGVVEIEEADGTWKQIGPGTSIRHNDHVRTDAGGRLRVVLKDDTIFTMGPNSDMVMDDFVYDPRTDLGKITVRVISGIFRFVTGKVATKDPKNMKVKTGIASLGDRGTDFAFDYYRTRKVGRVYVHKGAIDIVPIATGKTTVVGAGMTAQFNSHGKVTVKTLTDAAWTTETKRLTP